MAANRCACPSSTKPAEKIFTFQRISKYAAKPARNSFVKPAEIGTHILTAVASPAHPASRKHRKWYRRVNSAGAAAFEAIRNHAYGRSKYELNVAKPKKNIISALCFVLHDSITRLHQDAPYAAIWGKPQAPQP